MINYEEFKFTDSLQFAAFVREGTINNEIKISEILNVNDESFVKRAIKPNKFSILHEYLLNYYIGEFDFLKKHIVFKYLEDDWLKLLDVYQIKILKTRANFKDQDAYIEYLAALYRKEVAPRVAEEMFYILFSDRFFLMRFGENLSNEIKKKLKVEDFPKYLIKDGRIKRNGYWQSWVTKAVFYRDKGRCTLCQKDLTGLVIAGLSGNIDHIVPLKIGGVNDISNLQLLCENCNKTKGGDIIITSEKYAKYY